jgi:hypothetical protein
MGDFADRYADATGPDVERADALDQVIIGLTSDECEYVIARALQRLMLEKYPIEDRMELLLHSVDPFELPDLLAYVYAEYRESYNHDGTLKTGK